jgi:hypothetical protein
MSKPRKQAGYVFESNGSLHIRFYVHENGKRRQRSVKLCIIDSDHPSPDAPSVIALAEAFMLKINEANSINDLVLGHNCPICGYRCRHTIQGRFAKKA